MNPRRLSHSPAAARLAAAGALLVAPRAALAQLRAPSLARLSVRNPGRQYFGDRRLFASVSPGVAGRDTASVAFSLDRPAAVRLEAVRTALRRRTTVWQTEKALRRGLPPALVAAEGRDAGRHLRDAADGRGRSGNRKTYGGSRPAKASRSTTPVVRILGVEAAFDKRSYAPLEPAQLTITADAERHHASVPGLRDGDRVHRPHGRDARRAGRAAPLLRLVAEAVAPHTIAVNPGAWVSGVYARS